MNYGVVRQRLHYRGTNHRNHIIICVNDTSKAVEHFYEQLVTAGAARSTASQLRGLYESAITRGDRSSWERLYNDLFFAMHSLTSPIPTESCRSARQSLLRLLCDDLGSSLFSAEMRRQLHVSLFHPAAKRSGTR